MNFPEDFTVEDHQVVKNAKQWLLKKDDALIAQFVDHKDFLMRVNANT
jgi:hypothetical protein